VLNQRGDTIVSFSPHKFGLGSFRITPEPDQKYQVILIDPAGIRRVYAFPDIRAAGYSMQLTDSANVLRLVVRSKGVSPGNVYLFAHARQIIASAQARHLENQKAVFMLDKNSLAAGI